jgi:hypothetical protein
MTQPTHTPTGDFPDLDGTLGDGPLQIQATGEVFSSAILIKSAAPNMGLMCKLIDACDWLKTNAADRLTTLFATTGSSVTRVVSGVAVARTGTWTQNQFGGNLITAVDTLSQAVLPIQAWDLPHGATLTGVSVRVIPAVHASIASLTLPNVSLWSITAAGVSTQIGGTTVDPSADVTAYNLNHEIAITGLSTLIDRSTKRYYMEVRSEFDAPNALAGLILYGGSVTFNAP